jgi:outer membrane protein OmpA-like peptidoglycan-associated protein
MKKLASLIAGCTVIGVSPGARAEQGAYNLRLEPAVGQLLGEPADRRVVGAAFGLDTPVWGPVAVEVRVYGLDLPRRDPSTAFGLAAGARARLLSGKGYARDGGSLFGNLWVSGAVNLVDVELEPRLGVDAAAGFELALIDPMQVGPYVRVLHLGDSAAVVAGLTFSFAFSPSPAPAVAPTSPVEDPAADRDLDGIPDDTDLCPDKPGTGAHAGCPPPPPDRDGDGVPEADDACPDQPGVAAHRGCVPPPPDQDQDGTPDADDACPDQPGVSAHRGCPPPVVEAPAEPEPPRAILEKQRIRITGTIEFETGSFRLRPGSTPLIASVAEVMLKHPEIRRLRVEGHTDDVASQKLNQRLSEQRARAVVDQLVRMGVQRKRLTAVGYGSSQPVEPGSTPEARARNRRVEFTIIDPPGGVIEAAQPSSP